MSQTTRCPSCGTKFKVVADQLRISEGWVRCGQCEEVFDARLTLESPDKPSAPVVPAALAAPVPAPAPAPAEAAGYALPTAVDDDEDLPLEIEADRATAPEPELEAEPEPEPELEAEPEPEPEPQPEREADPEPEPEQAPHAAFSPFAGSEPAATEDPFALPHHDARPYPAAAPLPEAEPGFVRTARRKALWQRPGVRLALAAGSAALLLVLALQVTLQERNALAAWKPSLRPALQGLCALAGCTLSARQDIAQVVISSSAFTRTAQADGYLLTLTIENQAATELAMPSVELTLTDLQDQAVLRRVLLPADLQAPPTLGAQAEWSVRLPLTVTATPTRIAGYRALVFYP